MKDLEKFDSSKFSMGREDLASFKGSGPGAHTSWKEVDTTNDCVTTCDTVIHDVCVKY